MRKKISTLFLCVLLSMSAFAAQPNTGPAPDYGNLLYWAASPYKQDASDSIPDFIKGEVRTQKADVFFIHPTSYVGVDGNLFLEDFSLSTLFKLRKLSWNADLTDEKINDRTDNRTILNQATVFNGSCRVFAPRYRQANIKAFFRRDSDSSRAAFDLAYSDIKKAFEYYLQHENNGRPIIIASHSQGTLHAIRLLQEYFDGTKLQSQLVCAYIIGYQIPLNSFKHIPLSAAPDAVGGFVTWRCYQKGELPRGIKKEDGNSFCVNPITWTTNTQETQISLSKGIVVNLKRIAPQGISAQIEPDVKILWITLPENKYKDMSKLKNLHTFDYNLFWLEIRENVNLRISAYLRKQ